MIRNKTEYAKLNKNSFIEYLSNLVLILPEEKKPEFILDLEEEIEKKIDSEIDFVENLKQSKKHFEILKKKLSDIKILVLKEVKMDYLIEKGFNSLFLSPHLRFNDEIIQDLIEIYKFSHSSTLEDELNIGKFIQNSKNIKIRGHIQGILTQLKASFEDYLIIFKKDEFQLILSIYFLYNELKQEIRKDFEFLELNEVHLGDFDKIFIQTIIDIFSYYWKENELDLNLDSVKELLNIFCRESYEKIGIKIHPFPWTCY